jgi:hypothetical protein
MFKRRNLLILLVLFTVLIGAWRVGAEDLSMDLTAKYVLDVVRAFRTAYVLKVVEHTSASGVSPNENWKQDSHFIPLPAQFVKEAAAQLESFDVGLIGLTPLNPANAPKTQAESDALIQLMKNRERPVQTFVDGDYFKAISADLALVQSCVDCHNQHPKAVNRDFKRWDVMGGLVVRFKLGVNRPDALSIGPDPSRRPASPLEKMTPPQIAPPPWVP